MEVEFFSFFPQFIQPSVSMEGSECRQIFMKAKKKKTPSPQSNWFLAFIGTPNFDPLAEGTAADYRRHKIEPDFISQCEKENVVFTVIRPTS